MKTNDPVNNPNHYNWHPKIECKDICMYFNWNKGNAIKYIFRSGYKGENKEVQDLERAIFLIKEEIKRIKATQGLCSDKKNYFDTNYVKLENL